MNWKEKLSENKKKVKAQSSKCNAFCDICGKQLTYLEFYFSTNKCRTHASTKTKKHDR